MFGIHLVGLRGVFPIDIPAKPLSRSSSRIELPSPARSVIRSRTRRQIALHVSCTAPQQCPSLCPVAAAIMNQTKLRR